MVSEHVCRSKVGNLDGATAVLEATPAWNKYSSVRCFIYVSLWYHLWSLWLVEEWHSIVTPYRKSADPRHKVAWECSHIWPKFDKLLSELRMPLTDQPCFSQVLVKIQPKPCEILRCRCRPAGSTLTTPKSFWWWSPTMPGLSGQGRPLEADWLPLFVSWCRSAGRTQGLRLRENKRYVEAAKLFRTVANQIWVLSLYLYYL